MYVANASKYPQINFEKTVTLKYLYNNVNNR